MTDAAFREALDDYVRLSVWERTWACGKCHDRPGEDAVDAASTRVLALYAEASRGMTPEESAQYKAFLRSRFTPAERQGEVYEVAFIQPDCGDPTVPEHAEEWGVGLHGTMPGWLHPGDRVRVTKVEEE